MPRHTDLLIIGAGPFGLAMAAYAKALDIDHILLGKPMDFWRSNMPEGMILRSACDWHLDPLNVHTIEKYLQTQNLRAEDLEPLTRDFYLGYTRWFQKEKQIQVVPSLVQRLELVNGASRRFMAALDDATSITANHALLALGFRYFKNVPAELADIFPSKRYSHTCDLVNFAPLNGRRCLVIGGRQSAFEWAALLRESGAAAVHVSYRHETPAFEKSDWSWVNPMVNAMVENPGWYRNLASQQKEDLGRRFWAEGRLKLEPWLAPRINHPAIKLWPKSRVVGCHAAPTGELAVFLDNGASVTIDQIVLATGYKVNIENVPLLAHGNLLGKMQLKDGYPVLDKHLQSSVPGLFFTSMAATQAFGPFFAFTVSVVASTRIIGSFLKKSAAETL